MGCSHPRKGQTTVERSDFMYKNIVASVFHCLIFAILLKSEL